MILEAFWVIEKCKPWNYVGNYVYKVKLFLFLEMKPFFSNPAFKQNKWEKETTL